MLAVTVVVKDEIDLVFVLFCSVSLIPLLGDELPRKGVILKLTFPLAVTYGQNLLLIPLCLEKSCLSIDSVDQKCKPRFCLYSKPSAFVSDYKCSSLMGGLTLFLNVSVSCAAVPQMTQGKELKSPFRQNTVWLLLDSLWQNSQSAVLCWRKRPTDGYHLLCLWRVEQEPLEPAGPKEAQFILCLVKQGLWTVCRPSLFINNPQPWPPAVLFQVLSSVLPPDSIYLTPDLLTSFLKAFTWDSVNRELGSLTLSCSLTSNCLCVNSSKLINSFGLWFPYIDVKGTRLKTLKVICLWFEGWMDGWMDGWTDRRIKHF